MSTTHRAGDTHAPIDPGGDGPPGPAEPGRRPRRPARRSRIWLVIGTIIAVPTLLMGAFQVVVAVAHEEEQVTDIVDARGITDIEVRNPTGRVEIVGADVDEITVRSEVSHGLRRSGYGHRTDGDRLIVWGTCPLIGSSWCEVKQRIEIPMDLAVEVRSAGGLELRSLTGPVEAGLGNDSIDASDLAGPTRLRSTNESVTVTNHRGTDLEARSSNGDLHIDFEETPERVEAKAVNGDVSVMLPADDEIRYAVTVESNNGDQTNGVMTDPTSDRRVLARTTNGDATVRYR